MHPLRWLVESEHPSHRDLQPFYPHQGKHFRGADEARETAHGSGALTHPVDFRVTHWQNPDWKHLQYIKPGKTDWICLVFVNSC